MAELAAQQRRGAPAGSQSEGEADVSLFALRADINEKRATMEEQKARYSDSLEAPHEDESTTSHVKLSPRMCNFMLAMRSRLI